MATIAAPAAISSRPPASRRRGPCRSTAAPISGAIAAITHSASALAPDRTLRSQPSSASIAGIDSPSTARTEKDNASAAKPMPTRTQRPPGARSRMMSLLAQIG